MKVKTRNRIISLLTIIIILCSYLNIPQIEVHAYMPADAQKASEEAKNNEEETNTSSSSTSSGKMYDGKPLDNTICDSGFANSFEGGEYYDVTVPYTLTNEDIGGYATGTNGSNKMSDVDKKVVCGHRWNLEGDHTSSVLRSTVRTSSKLTITDVDGYCVAKDTNGTEYYLVAVPKYFYNSSTGIQWESQCGQVIELFFTDGKYIRAIVGDAKAVGHTNGGEGESHSPTGQDGASTTYTFSTLNYSQYQNIYQAENGETFEWFCNNPTVRNNTPGVAGSSGEVAYVRMYNINVATGDAPTLASGIDKSAIGTRTNTGCNITGTSDGTDSQATANAATGYVGGYYEEMDLEAYNRLSEENIQELYLDNATRNNLNANDLNAVTDWQSNVNAIQEESTIVKFFRKVIQLIAILFTIYAILVYIAYWFDRLNNFFDIDLLSILTFGKFMISESEDECTYKMKDLGNGKKKTVNHRAILSICIISIVFAALILTGTLFKLVAKIAYFFINLFKR
jgi:hypothetical protein